MWEVEAKNPFADLSEGKKRQVGERFYVSAERLKELMGENPQKRCVVTPIGFKHQISKEGPKIIIYQGYLYRIGGIETFVYNLVKTYRDKNITIMYDTCDFKQLQRLSKYCDLEKFDGKKHDCDVLIIANYDSGKMADRFNAKRVYQMCHADLEAFKKYPSFQNYEWKKHPKVDKIISVSETAALGLKKTFGYDSEIIYNLLDKDFKDDDPMVFVTLSRMTVEKGAERMVQMARKFKAAGKKFIWFVCCTLDQTSPRIQKMFKDIPEFIIVRPDFYNKGLIKNSDYLVQLSDTESFCYSAFEALQRGVPVILTDFPEARKIVEPGKNGYLVSMDLSDLDIEKIFNEVPKKVSYEDRCDYDKWEQVFEGRL